MHGDVDPLMLLLDTFPEVKNLWEKDQRMACQLWTCFCVHILAIYWQNSGGSLQIPVQSHHADLPFSFLLGEGSWPHQTSGSRGLQLRYSENCGYSVGFKGGLTQSLRWFSFRISKYYTLYSLRESYHRYLIHLWSFLTERSWRANTEPTDCAIDDQTELQSAQS